MAHYGLEPRTIHVGNPNENGDIESSNGGLKSAIEQHLLLRGSRDFETIEVYETWPKKLRSRLKSETLPRLVQVRLPVRGARHPGRHDAGVAVW
jgi:transposase InsO family protein